MRGQPARVVTLGMVLAACVAGCGSRADFTAAGAGASLSGSGSAATGPATGGASAPGTTPAGGVGGGAAGGIPGSARGSTAGGAAGASGPSGTTGMAGGAGGGSPGSAGSRSGAPVRVGFVLQDASGASALVGSNVPITSTQRQQQIAQWLVAYENAHGGIGGRKISPAFETVSITTQDAERVADCQAMAQDQHDQAVMDMNIMLTDADWACFARNHVNFFGNISGTDRPFLDKIAPYATTTWMGLDRQMYAMAHGASQAGFFKGAKVGIILPDTPEGHADFTGVLAPQLKAVGVGSYDARYITLADGGAQTSQSNNAELAFASEGVNRVLFFHDIVVYLQFTQQANAEKYYPEYAYPDFEGAAGVAAFYGSSTTNAGSIAVSSSPLYVLDDNSQNVKSAGTTVIDRKTASPGVRTCLDVLTKQSGVNFYDPNQSQDPDEDALYYCDELFLFVAAANQIPGGYTPPSFGAGLRQVATYVSPLQNSTTYASGHNDGASSYRVGGYQSSCSCFVKTTNWIGAPT